MIVTRTNIRSPGFVAKLKGFTSFAAASGCAVIGWAAPAAPVATRAAAATAAQTIVFTAISSRLPRGRRGRGHAVDATPGPFAGPLRSLCHLERRRRCVILD